MSATNHTLALLRQFESRNVTYLEPDGSWPIVWERARGVHVWDPEGRRYLDLTAAFGVAAAGHANRSVVRAGQKQMGRLLHAMGDVHPHRGKAELACKLSELTFERWDAGRGKTIFTSSGFEAVEAALKTAFLVTGRVGVIAFRGGYHGLGYGALNTTHREHFRAPFRAQLKEFATFVDFPQTAAALPRSLEEIDALLRTGNFGAVLVEPVQARGGINVPPAGWLSALGNLSAARGALLIADEIYTGFGRTGRWFACEHDGAVPDLLCLGKALTGGFPLSACVGKASLMDDAWPPSTGEAIHTSTFLGHPVGCAMALANLEEIGAKSLVTASEEKGAFLLELVRNLRSPSLRIEIRGLGLMLGVALFDSDGEPATEASLGMIKRLLHRGFIFLPEGEHASVIAFTPPLTISQTQLRSSVNALSRELKNL